MRLFLLSLILWCQCALAQFGGVQQPMFSMQSAVPAETFATNLVHRWVASDVTNAFLTWTDRVSSRVLGVDNGYPMYRDSTTPVVCLTNTTSLTNGGTDALVSGDDYAIGFMLWMQDSINSGLYLYRNSAGVSVLMEKPSWLYKNGETGVQLFSMPINTGFDVIFVTTNTAGPGDSWTVVYTNGVLANATTTANFRTPVDLFRWGNPAPDNAYGPIGFCWEIWTRTNGLASPAGVAGMAADIHFVRTNLYGP